jgi:hypothetical protein
MSKHRVLSFKPYLRLEWRSQDGQNETEQPDHSASLSDSITASTRIGFSVHTAVDVARGESSFGRGEFVQADANNRRSIGVAIAPSRLDLLISFRVLLQISATA